MNEPERILFLLLTTLFSRCYFDVCDGVYLNYNWKEEEISRSCEAAKDSLLDVYVGIDIWGRGSYGGGCFNAYKAAKVIYEHNMSMEIFAPGWEHENNPQLPKEDFLKSYYSRSNLLWKLFWPYMFTTPIERCFTTLFRTGVTTEHYNLQSQDVQPSYFPSHCITTETCNIDVAKDICGCVQESIIDNSRYLLLSNEDVAENNVVHRLFATEIKLEKKIRLDIFVDTSGENKKCDYDVVLLLADNLDNIKKVVCTLRNLSATMEDVEVVLPLKVSTNDFEEDILKHWDRRSFSLEYPQYRILEIGIKLVDEQLRKEINLYHYVNLVKSVNILHHISDAAVQEIVTNLKMELFLPNDVIIKARTEGDCMYFLAAGTVAMYTPMGREICNLTDGCYFGEVELIRKDNKRITSVIAKEICEVYRLERKDFKRSLTNEPETYKYLEKVALDRATNAAFLEELHKKHILERNMAVNYNS